MRTACSPLSRISFGRMLSFFDPLVNLHSLTIQFLILFCQQLCHAKLFVSHLGWKLSAAIMMKRLNLHVIRLIYTLCKHLHVSAQSTISLFVHVMFCMPQVHMCSKTPTKEPSHLYLLSRCGELKNMSVITEHVPLCTEMLDDLCLYMSEFTFINIITIGRGNCDTHLSYHAG